MPRAAPANLGGDLLAGIDSTSLQPVPGEVVLRRYALAAC